MGLGWQRRRAVSYAICVRNRVALQMAWLPDRRRMEERVTEARIFYRGQRVRALRDVSYAGEHLTKNPEGVKAGGFYTVRDYGTSIGIWLVEVLNGPWSSYVPSGAGYGGPSEPTFWQGHFAPVDCEGMAVLREIAENPQKPARALEPA